MINHPISPSPLNKLKGTTTVQRGLPNSRFFPAGPVSPWLNGLNPVFRGGECRKVPYIIAVGGGKGGVGKSMLSANLAIHLCGAGFRCLALDFDMGSSNLHTYFGLQKPAYSLADLLQSQLMTFDDIMQPAAMENLYLINSGDLPPFRQLDDEGQSERFSNFFSGLLKLHESRGMDFIIIDLGAGTHAATMDLFALGHIGVVVSHPEPTSIENSYAFLRSHLWHLYENTIKCSPYAADLQQFRYLFQKFKPRQSMVTGGGYLELLSKMRQHYPQIGSAIAQGIDARRVAVVLNQSRTHRDQQIGKAIEHVSQSYFGLHAQLWATLNNDDLAWQALRSRSSLAQFAPYSHLSREIKSMAARIAAVSEDQTSWTI